MKPKSKTKKYVELFAVPEEEVEELNESGDDAEPEEHDSLVKSLIKNSKLIGNDFKWKSKRTEANSKIDEFGISKDEKTRVSLHKLLKTSKNVDGKKKLRSFEQKAVTAAPLRTPLAKRAARKANFTEVSGEVTKYDPIIKELRTADQVVFPLEQERVSINVSSQLGTSVSQAPKTKPLCALEKDIEEHLTKNVANVEFDNKPFTENELAILKAKSVEEARIIHREIQKRRLLISFQESKYRRLRKIKSKKYHKLLKKEKLKKTVDEFDQMVTDNPEKALEKLEELNKLRALERASLKHHNTGKWAKHQKIRAKYDDNARDNMNANLKINSDLLRKRSLALLDEIEDSEEEEENSEDTEARPVDPIEQEELQIVEKVKEEVQQSLTTSNTYNPWISSEKSTHKKRKTTSQPTEEINLDSKAIDDFLRREIERRIRQEKQSERAKIMALDSVDERNIITDDRNDEPAFTFEDNEPNTATQESNQPEEELGHHFDEFDFHNNEFLREAFIDDDVVEEFYKEKEDRVRQEEEARKGKKKIEVLPGWGDWAGAGIVEDAAKKKKFLQKEIKKQKWIDTRISNAIVLKDADQLGAKFRVPYRPASVCDPKVIEKMCSKPVGSTWNPQTVYKNMTEPAVITSLGRIIEPMSSRAADQIEI